MALKLQYITNRPEVAEIAEQSGVDRIFVDMEYIGKAERQHGMDSVKNHHSIKDISAVRKKISKSQLLVRVNPIHDEQADGYPSSETEIQQAINTGADIIMLPYYKTTKEVERFLSAVNDKALTMLLLETAEAAELIDETVLMDGIDEVHIGLNDLSISYKKKFMFELLADGTVERICRHLHWCGKPYGFGGLASLGRGLVPAELILKEHYRLDSTGVILSRSFCNVDKFLELSAIKEIFYRGIREIRILEQECEEHVRYFTDNQTKLSIAVQNVVKELYN